MTITERIGPTGSPRRTRVLIGVCMLLMAAGFIWLAVLQINSDARNQAKDTAQDQVIAQQVRDAQGYRQALASRGVNPDSIAPPPQVRTAPLASLPAATGPTDAQVQAAVDRHFALYPPPSGTPGRPGADSKVPGPTGSPGPAPPCLSESAQCVGATGDKGDPGGKGDPGSPGKGIASVTLRQTSPGECELAGTYTDGSEWTAGGATIPCASTVEPTPSPSPTVEPLSRPQTAHAPTVRPSAAPSRHGPVASPSAPARGARRVLPELPLDWATMLLVSPFGFRRSIHLGEGN